MFSARQGTIGEYKPQALSSKKHMIKLERKKIAYLYYRWSHNFVFGSDVLPFFKEVLGPEVTEHLIFFIHSTVCGNVTL